MKKIFILMFFITFSFSSFADIINNAIKEELFKDIYIGNKNIENIVTIRNNKIDSKITNIIIKKNINNEYLITLPTLKHFYGKGIITYNPEVLLNFIAKREYELTTLDNYSIKINNNIIILPDDNFFIIFSVESIYYFIEDNSSTAETFQWYSSLIFGTYF